jgi:hypothetical protein
MVYTCRKKWLHTMPKAAMTHAKLKALLLKRNIEPTTESTVVVQSKTKDRETSNNPTIPTQISLIV